MSESQHVERVEQLKQQVVDEAVQQAQDPRVTRMLVVAMAGMFGAILALTAAWWWTSASQQQKIATLQNKADTSGVQVQQLAGDGQKLAAQVRSMGGTPVVQPPTVGPAGAPGVQGPAGKPGRGITNTQIITGSLWLYYTDGTSENAGPVVGPAGTPGAAGAPGANGRGITGTSVSDGHLWLKFSDNTSQDVGAVVGPAGAPGTNGKPGRGVQKVDGSTGRLVVTYDDGSTQDAGPLPAGPQGPPGPAGPSGPTGAQGRGISSVAFDFNRCKATVYYTDGSSQDAPMNGCQPIPAVPTPTK